MLKENFLNKSNWCISHFLVHATQSLLNELIIGHNKQQVNTIRGDQSELFGYLAHIKLLMNECEKNRRNSDYMFTWDS